MFEAKLAEALVLKKIIDAIKDLVTDVNIDATPAGKSIYHLCSTSYIFSFVLQASLYKPWTVRTSHWSVSPWVRMGSRLTELIGR